MKSFRPTVSSFPQITMIAAAIGLAACAAPAGAAGSDEASIVHHACAMTMGLNPSEAAYQGCILSLNQTLAEQHQSLATEDDRRACADKGLQPGTSGFALCVVDLQNRGR